MSKIGNSNEGIRFGWFTVGRSHISLMSRCIYWFALSLLGWKFTNSPQQTLCFKLSTNSTYYQYTHFFFSVSLPRCEHIGPNQNTHKKTKPNSQNQSKLVWPKPNLTNNQTKTEITIGWKPTKAKVKLTKGAANHLYGPVLVAAYSLAVSGVECCAAKWRQYW